MLGKIQNGDKEPVGAVLELYHPEADLLRTKLELNKTHSLVGFKFLESDHPAKRLVPTANPSIDILGDGDIKGLGRFDFSDFKRNIDDLELKSQFTPILVLVKKVFYKSGKLQVGFPLPN